MAKKDKILSGNIASNSLLFKAVFFGVLLVIVIALFNSFVFSDKMLYSSDQIQAGVMFRSFYMDYFRDHGRPPVWNPFQFCGIPYIDGFHGDTFYPLSFIPKLLLSADRALGWNMLFHVLLAGITMFMCARTFGRSQVASSLAAVSYMLAAYLISQVAPGHDGKMYVTALFPLTLLLIEKAFEGRRPALYFALLGLTIGVIILTPHPQMAYYTLWACAFYFTYRLIFLIIDTKVVTKAVLPIGLFVLAVVVGLSISAIHFYPGYNYVQKYSPRSDEKRGMDWAKSWSMHAEEAVSLIVPEFSGVSTDEGNTYWGRNAFKDNSEYAGAIPLMLAIVAVAMVRSRKTWFFGGLAVFALIYALAANTPFFYIFYHLIPNVKSTRAWSMIMFLFSFSIALLAAFAIDFIIQHSRQLKDNSKRLFQISLFGLPALVLLGALFFSAAPEAAVGLYKGIFYSSIPAQKAAILQQHLPNITAGFWIMTVFLGATAVIVWLFSRKALPVAALLIIVALAVIDGYRFDSRFIRTVDYHQMYPRLPLADWLMAQEDKYRVLDLTSGYLPANYFPTMRIEDMNSQHGNQPRWFQNLIGGTAMRNLFNLNLMNMTNTRYLVLSPRSPIRGEQLGPAGFTQAHTWQNFQIYENPMANDRATMIYNWVVEPDEEKLSQMILGQSFNPATTAALMEDPGIIPIADTIQPVGRTEIVEYENDHITIAVETTQPGLLVLADNWYPSWKAFVDDEEQTVYRTNAAFRGVVVPAGNHTVEFRYISQMHWTGMLLTLAGLAVVGVVAVAGGLRKKPLLSGKKA